MKASEVVRIWSQHEVSHNIYKWNSLYAQLQQGGDFEVDTTPELMALSEECDRQGKRFVFPHLTCYWYSDNPSQLEHDWRYGHRPEWWVCARCKIVNPCGGCYKADVDGYGDWGGGPDDDNGKCPYCGRPLGELLLARIREVRAIEEEIEWTRIAFSMAGVGFVDQPPTDWCLTMRRPWELLRKMRHIEHLQESNEPEN
jgi:hypothetical protein